MLSNLVALINPFFCLYTTVKAVGNFFLKVRLYYILFIIAGVITAVIKKITIINKNFFDSVFFITPKFSRNRPTDPKKP